MCLKVCDEAQTSNKIKSYTKMRKKYLIKFLLIMKLTFVFSFLVMLHITANEVQSQNSVLTLNMNLENLGEVINLIEDQSEFKVFYKNEQVNLDHKIFVESKTASVSEILACALEGTNIDYTLMDKVIVLTPRVEKSAKQDLTVTGTVKDIDGSPLPGVNVVIKGSTVGAVTDMDGNYSIILTSPDDILLFSFIGYQPQEVVVAGQTVIDIVLAEDVKLLDEVVVVGYGTVKRSDITGSLVSITAESLQERPVVNALQAIQGKAAGVDVFTNRRPGEVPNILVRGNKSLTATTAQKQPLYIVDGLIHMGDLNDINPNDIASMEILKDASATAIYGSRGANGVVLITTKRGSKGKVNVNYNVSYTLDKIHSLTDWASAGEALDRKRLAYHNGNYYASDYPDPALDITRFGNNDYWTIDAIRKGYEWNDPGTYTDPVMRETTQEERDKGWPDQVPKYNSGNIPTYDWLDLLTQTGTTADHNLAISSGTEKSNLYFSFGYTKNKGTQLNQDYKRYTVKLNGDVKLSKWLIIGSDISASRSEQNYGSTFSSTTGAKDLYGQALNQYPLAQPYDTLGELIEFPGSNLGEKVWNPLINAGSTQDLRTRNYFQGNFFSEIKFTPWLKYRMNFGTGMRYYKKATWKGKESTFRRSEDPPTGTAQIQNDYTFQWVVENLLYVDKTFGIHTFGITLLQSAQQKIFEEEDMGADGLINDTPKWHDLFANIYGTTADYRTDYEETTQQSYMGRINYSLMDKYLLTASIRRDGSSVLAKKWELFPSMAFAWKVNEENFLKPIKAISQLKLRLGYGVVGNASVDPYVSTGPLSQYNYIFGTTVATGYIPGYIPNNDLGWEKTHQYNMGLDVGLLAGRISGSVDLYKSNIDDLLMLRDIPAVTGMPKIWYNIAKMENRGIEISLSTVNISTKDFSWSTDFSFAANREKIVELLDGKVDMKNQGGLNGVGWFIDEPANVYRTYQPDGLWQATAADSAEMDKWRANGYLFYPGQYKPIDRNGNYMLEDSDRVITGTPNPKWIGGLTNTFTYKNISLSFFMYARIGQSYYMNLDPQGVYSTVSYTGYTRHEDLDQFWSVDNPGGKYPEPCFGRGISAVTQSNYVNDGSFVIMRNISLTYDVPRFILDRIKINSLQVYAQVLNPFIWGGEVVKAGFNPDDTGYMDDGNSWGKVNSRGEPAGGLNNNTVIVRSWVFGARVSL